MKRKKSKTKQNEGRGKEGKKHLQWTADILPNTPKNVFFLSFLTPPNFFFWGAKIFTLHAFTWIAVPPALSERNNCYAGYK